MPFTNRLIRHAVLGLSLTGTALLLLVALTWDGSELPRSSFLPFRLPVASAMDQRGRVYVVDTAGTRLVALGRNGSLRWTAGATDGPSSFSALDGVTCDAEGRVYLVDRGRNRVVRMTPAGAFDRVLFSPPGGKLLSFEIYGTAGWAVVTEGALLRTYQVTLDGTSRSAAQGVSESRAWALVVPSPTSEMAGIDEKNRLWVTDPARGWVQQTFPGLIAAMGARYFPDGTLVVLDRATRCWYTRPPGETTFQLFHGAPRGTGLWGPWPTRGPDGTLVLCDPAAHAVQVESGTTSLVRWSGAHVGWWLQLRSWMTWILLAVGVVAVLVAAVLAIRRLLRRAFDQQLLQVLLLLPVLLGLQIAVQQYLQDEAVRVLEARQTEVLSEAAQVAVQRLSSGDTRTALKGLLYLGQQSGAFGYVRVLDKGAGGFSVAVAEPDSWSEGIPLAGMPKAALNLVDRQVLVSDYEDPRTLRRSAFIALGRSDQVVEIGLARAFPSNAGLTPLRRQRSFLFLNTALVLLAALALAAGSLWSAAPRYTLARVLTTRTRANPEDLRRYFPRTATDWSHGKGPDRGTVLILIWGPEGPRPREAFERRTGSLAKLGQAVKDEGGLVAEIWPEGVLILHPGPTEDSLVLAQILRHRFRPHRVVLDVGPWAWKPLRRTDRMDLVVSSPAKDGALALVRWEPELGVGILAPGPRLADSPGTPWRPVDLDGQTIGQVLDPADPGQAALLDYLAPHREAFDALAAGDFAAARAGFEFLTTRLPDDPVVRRLAGKALL